MSDTRTNNPYHSTKIVGPVNDVSISEDKVTYPRDLPYASLQPCDMDDPTKDFSTQWQIVLVVTMHSSKGRASL